MPRIRSCFILIIEGRKPFMQRIRSCFIFLFNVWIF
jgi:hypothetical protein